MAYNLNHEEFVGNPSILELKNKRATKEQLKYIAKNFGIQYSHDTRKDDLMTLILVHLGADKEATDKQESSPLDSSLALEIERVKANALLMKMKHDKEQRQIELEYAERQHQHEKEQRQLELESAERQRQHELQMAQLRGFSPSTSVHISKHLPLLPQFVEEDPDTFFSEFESQAATLEIEKKHWALLLKSKLTSKALIIVNGLEHNMDYDVMKKGLLTAYSITPEGCRQKFRNLTKTQSQTYLEFASDKLRAFKKWLQTSAVTTYVDLINLMVLEEFRRRVSFPIKLHIDDRDEIDLMKAAEIADKYSLTHRASGERKPESIVKSSAGNAGSGKTVESGTGAQLFCLFCKKTGHLIKNCPNPKCKVAKAQSTFTKPVASFNVSDSTSRLFDPFRSSGTVSTDHKVKHPIRIARDTCGSQSLVIKSVVPGIEQCYTGEKIYINDFHGPIPIPLAKVTIDCPLIKGEVKVAVCDFESIPVPDCDFLLCNELMGGVVFPPLRIKDSPLTYNPTEELESSKPGLFPMCAVTRSQARQTPPQSPTTNPSTPSQVNLTQLFSEKVLYKAQREDSTLSKYHDKITPKDQITHYPSFYYQDDILMRVFRPSHLSDDATWAEVHQIVLPCNLRQPVMEIAHEAFAGHLGITKTCDRILSEFYWPGMKKDVSSFVNTCHTCQVVGKPNQTIPPYPLQPIHVPSEPFTKIVIDVVGPLPKTKKGNQYILTILDPTTRYPEAFPLKNITSKSIVSKLTTMFTTFGIPQEIQSDRGSNFTSDLFKAVITELGITQTLSTAYHPQSQGALERCHQTLKSLLRKFCHERDQEWDEALPYMLFAIRETPNESLGISPFELLYGRKVRGPLRLIKDKLLNTSSQKLVTVTKYLDHLKSTLLQVREFARNNLKHAQQTMKATYDKATSARTFQKGDQVLAFIPVPGSPLKAKYHGPYEIVKKVSETNYILNTPDRRKPTQAVHINLIKLYKSRNPAQDSPADNVKSICAFTMCYDVPDVHSPCVQPEILNSQVLSELENYLSSLNPSQARDVSDLIHKHSEVFGDHPKRCTLISHDVTLLPGTSPIRQAPYRSNPQKRLQMQKEVDYLLEQGLAVPSKSPWASPCLLVPKEDGQLRFCTDYRRVNAVTVPDAYPLPRVDDLIDEVGQAKYITKIDLLKGYYQIPLTEDAQQISAFITPFGLFHYLVAPFGMRNCPATFQRAMNSLTQGLEGVSVYIDDVLLFSNSWEEHLTQLAELLRRLQEARLTVKLAKSRFGMATVLYLGHEVGYGCVRPKTANVAAVLDFPVPTTKREIRRFLGMAGFYRRFCPNFAEVAAPLTNLTSGKVKYVWDPACQEAFIQLKNLLAQGPVLQAPDFTKPFALQTDASDTASGAVLLQEKDDILHPIAYHSVKFNCHQQKYSTIEKELLAIIQAVKKFECYLTPSHQGLKIYTDHNPLTFLHRNKFTNQRLLRWSLLLQPYNITLHHIKGSHNCIADALSRSFETMDDTPRLHSSLFTSS